MNCSTQEWNPRSKEKFQTKKQNPTTTSKNIRSKNTGKKKSRQETTNNVKNKNSKIQSKRKEFCACSHQWLIFNGCKMKRVAIPQTVVNMFGPEASGSYKPNRNLQKTFSEEAFGPEATTIITHHTSRITHISPHHSHLTSPHHPSHLTASLTSFTSKSTWIL